MHLEYEHAWMKGRVGGREQRGVHKAYVMSNNAILLHAVISC